MRTLVLDVVLDEVVLQSLLLQLQRPDLTLVLSDRIRQILRLLDHKHTIKSLN